MSFIRTFLVAILFLNLSLVNASTPIKNVPCQAYSLKTTAVTWWRDSAERKAIYREVFLIAQQKIQKKVVSEKLQPRTWGVIVDIDETILDNSEWNKANIHGHCYDWDDYAAKKFARAIPGAKTFLQSIHQLGGNVNLVTNRSERLRQVTEKNLHEEGLYFDQILLKPNEHQAWYSDKNQRFNAVITGSKPSQLKAQHIVAWMGDNIQDFPRLKQTQVNQLNGNNKVYDEFGEMFFIIPNPMYGSWES